jgi:hypothetical protein
MWSLFFWFPGLLWAPHHCLFHMKATSIQLGCFFFFLTLKCLKDQSWSASFLKARHRIWFLSVIHVPFLMLNLFASKLAKFLRSLFFPQFSLALPPAFFSIFFHSFTLPKQSCHYQENKFICDCLISCTSPITQRGIDLTCLTIILSNFPVCVNFRLS